MISDETIGASVTAKTFLYLSVAASSSKMALISFTVTGFVVTNVISEIEPTTTGVRIATPSNLPTNSGMALVVAMAAPVVVGTRFWAAALPIRKFFLFGASTKD